MALIDNTKRGGLASEELMQQQVGPTTELMEKIIKISSVTTDSNVSLVKFLIPLLEKTGLTVKTQEVRENGRTFVNLFGFNRGLASADLLALNTHLDTVPISDRKDWTATSGDPWRLKKKGDKLYGLGTADVKIDFLCKLWGIQNSKPWKQPFVLVGTYGEERGLVGAKKLFDSGIVKPRYALIGEPSRLQIIFAHKGHIIGTYFVPRKKVKGETGKVCWKGKSCHSSTPDLGKNAIELAIRDSAKRKLEIDSITGGTAFNIIPDRCEALLSGGAASNTASLTMLLNELAKVRRLLQAKKDPRFNPSFNTLSVNQIATQASGYLVTFDIRLLPHLKVAVIEKELRKIETKVGCKLDQFVFDPPLSGDSDSTLVKHCSRALQEAGVPVVKRTKPTSTEAAIYNENGADAIVFGPGISEGNVHRPNEYNLISHIQKASLFYRNVLLRNF